MLLAKLKRFSTELCIKSLSVLSQITLKKSCQNRPLETTKTGAEYVSTAVISTSCSCISVSKPQKMGLATLSYTSTASFLNLPGLKVFSGQKRLLWSLCQTCCKQARDFQLLGLPVSRAACGHVCPAGAGMAIPGNSSSRVQLQCRGWKY